MWNHTQSQPLTAETMNLNSEELNYEQKLHKLLDLTPYLQYLDQLFNQPSSESESSESEDDESGESGSKQMWNASSSWGSTNNNSRVKPGQPQSSEPLSSSSASSESSSSSSTLSSSSSDGDDHEGLQNGRDDALDPFNLPPITDEELQNLFRVHKMWKKSPYPLGSSADIMSLLNATQQHPASSSSGSQKRPGASKDAGNSKKARTVSSTSSSRSRKQTLKVVRKEETPAATTSPVATTVAAPVVPTPAPIPSSPPAPLVPPVPPTLVVPPPATIVVTEVKQEAEPEAIKTEFEVLEAKPLAPPPLGNFMEGEEEEEEEEEEEDDEDDDHHSEVNNEDDNDSLSDFVSMAAAAQTGSSQLSATKNIVFKNVTSKAPPPASSSGPTSSTDSAAATSKKPKLGKKKLSAQKQAKIIEVLNLKRRRIYVLLCKKEIGKTQRARTNNHKENLIVKRRLATACSRILRQRAIQSQKVMKESVWRAKRLTREMLAYWKQADRVEREVRKRREKEAEEQRKMDVELMEAKRQQRKLNFLITQTELYAHFMSKKLGGRVSQDESVILSQLNEQRDERLARIDDYDSEVMKRKAKQNVENAFTTQQNQVKLFDLEATAREEFKSDLKLESSDSSGELQQPKMFEGVLKHYQLKGVNWLASLYDQGINGILADEMGLGKTVQSMAFLAHVAEHYGVWGPFLVIAPASTLHNWQQEFKRFVPRFKVVPYWGTPQERKILRQFWQNTNLHTEEASFHVVVTSYQIVMTDIKYFNRVKWQYLILDEAQAIKSSSSARWKMLLGFSCRNRLLLTGTPIQNTMAELWALLHFIMPSLFDSHEEFNEWFSKDIESHAENKSLIDEKHLSRLHLILKPFMLRRIKKDVENELSDKVEVLVHCPLTTRQRQLYAALKKKIKIEDLLKSSGPANSQLAQHATTNLMNLVMQFRKVCNHPDLFERRRVQSPHSLPKIIIQYPRLLFRDVILDDPIGPKHLISKMSVFSSSYVHSCLHGNGAKMDSWSFLRILGMSGGELDQVMRDSSVVQRWKLTLKLWKRLACLCHHRSWSEESRPLSLSDLLLNLRLNSEELKSSAVLQDLVFAKPGSRIYSFKAAKTVPLEPMLMPSFLYYTTKKVTSSRPEPYFSDRGAAWRQEECFKFASEEDYNVIMTGKEEKSSWHFVVEEQGGLEALEPTHGWSPVVVPAKEKLISDSGKLGVLDVLLKRLKSNSHRVLIYSQMTKMIDILEEYMCLRKWTYMRLDGSSKISERRDMVADFQSRSDIFVFLLSTRAGGLGINLTAADTVIFYDSDWNPTVDQQAMDRAHRLGQTKQVHVYRLICKGTIEERILQRAREKNEIQRMVISGGNFRSDTLKPREVVSLLLDDEELEKKYRQRQAEKRLDEAKQCGKQTTGDSALKKIAGSDGKESNASVTVTATGSARPRPTTEEGQQDQTTNEVELEAEENNSNVGDDAEDDSSVSSQDTSSRMEALGVTEGFKTIEWNADSVSDYEGEFAVLPKRPKVGRGTGKRGRPPSRIRLPAREIEVSGDGSTVRRGPGRPRLRPVGPANQGVRGRRPGRPPLTRKPESSTSALPATSSSSSAAGPSRSTSLTPQTPSQRVFGFYSSPDVDMT